MKLPNNSIGISDVLDYRECPARFAVGMRRHIELPPHLQIEPGEKDELPEATNRTNVYGSSIHHAIHLVDKEGLTHEQAIESTMRLYGTYLDPNDVALLREDLDAFERRRPLGVTLVASEQDMRVPLFVHEGEQIYFRFKLDALYKVIANPSVFIHVDYKSSKWQKTAAEVHSDPQQWAYNWAIHERYPEVGTLLQRYDQLRYGVEQTTKSDEQRRDMKRWLIDMVKIILADNTYKPKLNQWCQWCPLVVTCREPRRATAYTRARLATLAPLTKEGRKVKVEFAEEGDELERIVADELPRFVQVRKHIEHLESELKGLIAQMPQAERERLGWALKERRTKKLDPQGLKELHERLGDATFYQLINLPMSRLEELVGKPRKGESLPPELELARRWTLEEIGSPYVVPAKS